MKLGIIAAATQRGLGVQSRSVYNALHPHVTVVVDPGPGRIPRMPVHPEWYPDGHVIEWRPDGTLPGAADLLSDCDVVWTAETFYDWTIPDVLANRGVRTVCHVNPELYHGTPECVALWLPSTWMRHQFPDAPVLITPAPIERYPDLPPLDPEPRIVHQAGTGPAGDRQGTTLLERCAPKLARNGITVDIQSQHERVRGRRVSEPWDGDAGAWMAVLPRRYGGQSLAASGWLAAGIPVAMPNIAPQATDWPIVPIPHKRSRDVHLKSGLIPAVDCLESGLIQTVTRVITDTKRLPEHRERARSWAEANSWAAWESKWWEAFRSLVD